MFPSLSSWQSSSSGTRNDTDRRETLPPSSTSAVPTAPWKMYWKATKSYCTLAFNCFVLNSLWRRKAVKSYCTQAFSCFTSNPLPWLHLSWRKGLGCSSGGMIERFSRAIFVWSTAPYSIYSEQP